MGAGSHKESEPLQVDVLGRQEEIEDLLRQLQIS
jgi:hypothetical protein